MLNIENIDNKKQKKFLQNNYIFFETNNKNK